MKYEMKSLDWMLIGAVLGIFAMQLDLASIGLITTKELLGSTLLVAIGILVYLPQIILAIKSRIKKEDESDDWMIEDEEEEP